MSRSATAYVLGIVVWFAILYGAYLGVAKIYRHFVPPPQVVAAVAAAFDERSASAARLHISGRVALDTQTPTSGLVRVHIERRSPSLTVTLLADLEQGRFELPATPAEAAALAPFEPGDRMLVTAEYMLPRGETTIHGEASAALNIRPWEKALPLIALGIAVALTVYMFFIFTGRYTEDKNRLAIGTAYATIGIALLLPFVAPAALNTFPSIRQAMAESPVGIVRVARAGNDASSIELHQWALNIGGIPRPATPADGAEAELPEGVYDVQSGIVIPLYVLILAILGGAVNMTREVPKLQRDLASVWGMGGGIQDMATELVRLVKFERGEGATVPERPAQPDAASSEAKQREMNRLRGELIVQYMYLITAPFLAIVTYYLLFMVEGKLAESIPIVVVVSFSAGLLSETVLRAVSQHADHYLEKLTAKLSADEPREPAPPDPLEPPPNGAQDKPAPPAGDKPG